jgi:hypothetical protein
MSLWVPALVLAAVLIPDLTDPSAAVTWSAHSYPVQGLEISGDARVWQREHVKSLDPVYDGSRGREARGDLMGFYFDQGTERLSVRLSLFRKVNTPHSAPVLEPGVRAFVLMDYMPGGRTELPAGIAGSAPFAWDRAIELTQPAGVLEGRVLDPDLSNGETGRLREIVASRYWTTLEASLELPGGFREAVTRAAGVEAARYDAVAARAAESESTPIDFYVFTAADGVVLDDIRANNAPTTNSHNVAFAQHLNQGLTYTTVFRGERGENSVSGCDVNNPDDGADELLDAHDCYDLPLNWHQGGLLISAAEWHDPDFNDWLTDGVTAGRYEILTSALGQQMMPFIRDEINGKSVSVENDMIQTHYGYTPRVAWTPERVWVESPDVDGNPYDASQHVIDHIGDDFTSNGVWAVILDDYIHCGYNNGPFDDHHVYTYSYAGGSIKVLPLDNDFVGQVNWNWGDAWNTILAGTSDEIIIYANDAEVAAEVSQGAGNPDALNNYIHLLNAISGAGGSVGTWKLTDVLNDPGFGNQALVLQNGTYGLLGEFYGYGGYAGNSNFWYGDWAAYTGESNLDAHVPKWDYGTQWTFTLNKLITVPVNNLSEMAWYVLMTNLHETGWHDEGEISGWQHHYSNHIRSANAHSEAARWAGGLFVDSVGAYIGDFEDDGTDELVMYNDRVLAVFDPIGGKLQWLFCKGSDYNYSVVSNDNVYWVDTNGDYNETNHVATLSDVSVGGINRENDFYTLEVVTATGLTVEGRAVHSGVTKTFSLTHGDPYLKAQYRASGERVYVKNGFTPDNLNLTWTGKALERVWDPDGGGYFGQKNTNTDATAAIIVGSAGATHNLQFSATLLEGDEFYGDGSFEVWVYGGYTSPADTNGRITELETLRDNLVDVIPPRPLSGVFYSSTDYLVLYFDEAIDAATVINTGIAFDDDDDGIADVTLTNSDSLLTTGYDDRLSFDLTPATASAIEALTGDIELLLAANTVQDAASNGNPLITNTDDIPVTVAPVTKYQMDGWLPDTDWVDPRVRHDDGWDSAWNGSSPGDTNEILVVFADWDSTYLYLGIRGHVMGNSWILYLDSDVDGPLGYTDLTRMDTWERGATFTASGFMPDFHYGAYQHQGPFDSQTMWRFTSDTTSVDISSQIVMAFDPDHDNGYEGGSEIAIPWDIVYSLGPGMVPPGATIGFAASVCWDPEPDGELGGDSAPNNISATLPTIDNFIEVLVDCNNDGIPDPDSLAGIGDIVDGNRTRLLKAYPSPALGATRVPIVLAASSGARASQVKADVFDITGRKVRTVFNGSLPAGRHVVAWDGTTSGGRTARAGIYFMRVSVDGQAIGSVKMMRLR